MNVETRSCRWTDGTRKRQRRTLARAYPMNQPSRCVPTYTSRQACKRKATDLPTHTAPTLGVGSRRSARLRACTRVSGFGRLLSTRRARSGNRRSSRRSPRKRGRASNEVSSGAHRDRPSRVFPDKGGRDEKRRAGRSLAAIRASKIRPLSHRQSFHHPA